MPVNTTNWTTPGGCRADNGRCFKRGGWEPTTQLGIVQFHDESVYGFGPLDEATWQRLFSTKEDPGCSWNFSYKDYPPTKWLKLGGYPEGLVDEFTAPPP